MKKSFRHTLACWGLTLVAAMCTQGAFAIKANPKTVPVKQPDGSTILVRIHGDENHHYMSTVDGYRVAADKDGFYKYVEYDKLSNRLVLTGVRAHNQGERTRMENNRILTLQKSAEMEQEWKARNQVSRKRIEHVLSPSVVNPSRNPNPKRRLPRAGAEPNESQYLCILVNFADCKMKFKNEDFNIFLNQRNYAGTGSVKDYYRDNSNGKFVPNFVTVGPYNLPQPQSAYANNDYDTGSDIDPRQMVIDAVKLAKERNPELDFSQFDNDGDGYMDNCYIIYAGYSEASTGNAGDMWPHSWTLLEGSLEVDGIKVRNYSCSQELVGTPALYPTPTMDGIGTFTHEFGHILGLDDMYDTDDYYNGYGIDPGAYSLYASGSYNNDSKTPAALWAFERLQMGWMEIGTDIKELKAGEDVIQDNSATTFTARYINCQPNRAAGTGYEWFILENRQFTGWDSYIPGHGLLIYHYDYTNDMVENWWKVNGPNNNARHRCLYIKPADGIDDDNSRSGDTYPGSSANTSFTDFTSPNALNWDGQKTNVPITNILERDGVIYYQAAGGATQWNVITTSYPQHILDNQADFSGIVSQHSGSISEMGFCWNEGYTEPTISSAHQTTSVSDAPTATVQGLKPGTTYTVKAYMKLADGTIVYGSPINFKTEYATAYAPFKTDFNQWMNGKIEGWEIIDHNSDGTTWLYDKQARAICYQFDYWNNADDWLICKRRYHVPENGALFFTRGVNEEQYIEGLEVYVSTTSSDIKDFYLHKQFSFADHFGSQYYEEVDLGMYAGQDIYIAFRCNSERMQGLLRLWDVRLEQKLQTPQITYFGRGDNDNQLKITWNKIDDASKYYLYLGRITESAYVNTVFTTLDYYDVYSQNVEVGTGHIFFKGNGFVELKSIPGGYEDLKFMLYPTGPIGTSYLEIEGTVDGQNWVPVCPRIAVSTYTAEGIECDYKQYVEGHGYTKIRFRFTDHGHLAHIRYLTVAYQDGYYWDQMAAGSVNTNEMLVNAKTDGEFLKGKFVAWVAAGTADNLFFDESEYSYYTPGSSVGPAPDAIEDMIDGTDIHMLMANGQIQLSGLSAGQNVSLCNAAGTVMSRATAAGSTLTLPTQGANGFAILKIGDITRKIIIR